MTYYHYVITTDNIRLWLGYDYHLGMEYLYSDESRRLASRFMHPEIGITDEQLQRWIDPSRVIERGFVSTENEEKVMKKQQKKYLWVRNGDLDTGWNTSDSENSMTIVDDLVELYRSPNFDPKTDKLYAIGAEIELVVTVKQQPNFRHPEGLKEQEGLGVGDYRG